MEITRNNFKKILLLNILLIFIFIPVELIFALFTNYDLLNYDLLEDKLNKGYLANFVNDDMEYYIYIILFILYLISIAFLYFLKPIGRIFYLATMISVNIFLTLNGDTINYGLSIVVNEFSIFLDYFILYIIYFTPFKNEFEKET